jgi:hypothetical protein
LGKAPRFRSFPPRFALFAFRPGALKFTEDLFQNKTPARLSKTKSTRNGLYLQVVCDLPFGLLTPFVVSPWTY